MTASKIGRHAQASRLSSRAPRRVRVGAALVLVLAAGGVALMGVGTAAAEAGCAETAKLTSRSEWAALRLAADQAWPQSRGKGQMVAIVDSGVDGNVPELKGHVAVGADIVTGSGRGDTDCLGTGTAMAGLIAGQPGAGSNAVGVAPDAMVMPVRVVTTSPKTQPADQATAIGVAVAGGATVIALGPHVNPHDPGVAKAILAATQHDVVVVFGAATALGAAPPNTAISDGALRVAGIGVDSKGAADYRAGGVDVVAPGVNVNSLGITGTGAGAGTGTHYAVAFVAGEAALVRAAHPDLTAQQVCHRIKATADRMGEGQLPDGRYGWGLINPAASVTTALPEEAKPAAAVAVTGSGVGSIASDEARTVMLVVITLVVLAAAALLIFRVRRLLRVEADRDHQSDPENPVGSAPLFASDGVHRRTTTHRPAARARPAVRSIPAERSVQDEEAQAAERSVPASSARAAERTGTRGVPARTVERGPSVDRFDAAGPVHVGERPHE